MSGNSHSRDHKKKQTTFCTMELSLSFFCLNLIFVMMWCCQAREGVKHDVCQWVKSDSMQLCCCSCFIAATWCVCSSTATEALHSTCASCNASDTHQLQKKADNAKSMQPSFKQSPITQMWIIQWTQLLPSALSEKWTRSKEVLIGATFNQAFKQLWSAQIGFSQWTNSCSQGWEKANTSCSETKLDALNPTKTHHHQSSLSNSDWDFHWEDKRACLTASCNTFWWCCRKLQWTAETHVETKAMKTPSTDANFFLFLSSFFFLQKFCPHEETTSC